MSITGRRTKCTPEVTKKVVEALENGNFFKIACQCAGVGESTGLLWMNKAREPRTAQCYKDFADAVEAASTKQEIDAVAEWKEHFKEDWRAIESFLKRRFPDRWGDKASLEHTGAGGGPIRTLDLSLLTNAQIKFLQDNGPLLEALFNAAADSSGDSSRNRSTAEIGGERSEA